MTNFNPNDPTQRQLMKEAVKQALASVALDKDEIEALGKWVVARKKAQARQTAEAEAKELEETPPAPSQPKPPL